MSYTKHIWQTGEYVSSEWLNHIEDGIEQAEAEASNTAETNEVLSYLGITVIQPGPNTDESAGE